MVIGIAMIVRNQTFGSEQDVTNAVSPKIGHALDVIFIILPPEQFAEFGINKFFMIKS